MYVRRILRGLGCYLRYLPVQSKVGEAPTFPSYVCCCMMIRVWYVLFRAPGEGDVSSVSSFRYSQLPATQNIIILGICFGIFVINFVIFSTFALHRICLPAPKRTVLCSIQYAHTYTGCFFRRARAGSVPAIAERGEEGEVEDS